MKTVTVGKVPGTLSNVVVEDGATIQDVLDAAGDLDAAGFEVKMNGSSVDLDDEVRDGANVFLVKQIKGNQCIVTVGKVPGTLKDLAVESDSTIQDVLNIAELDPDGFEIKVNGASKSLGDIVPDGANVFLVKQIKGNN